jgi:hypothetical protein
MGYGDQLGIVADREYVAGCGEVQGIGRWVLAAGKLLAPVGVAVLAVGVEGGGVGGAERPVGFAIVEGEDGDADVADLLLVDNADEVDEGGLAGDGAVGEEEADGVLGFGGDGVAQDGEAGAAAGEVHFAQRGGVVLTDVVNVGFDGMLPAGEASVLRGGAVAAGEEEREPKVE